MTSLRTVNPDNLHRGVKMALDTGEVQSIEDGYALFERYRLSIVVGQEIADSRAHQAALLTMVNAGRRSLLGGVHVVDLPDCPLLVELPGIGASLRSAVEALGGTLAREVAKNSAIACLGVDGPTAVDVPTIVVTFDGWRGGVGPKGEVRRLAEGSEAIFGATLAGALAISEIFQNLRGHVPAGRRTVGMSLWDPTALDWQVDDGAPEVYAMPSRIWLIGLGHLGQAYLWLLALFDFEHPADVEITLQDFDKLTEANDSTSMLTSMDLVGQFKTRAMAQWLEARGFKTRISERIFEGDLRLTPSDPTVALCGVDNLDARAALDEAGFKLVVEAGLGAGPDEYLSARVHTLPASVSSRSKWGGLERDRVLGSGSAYEDLVDRGELDRCGLIELATRTVGAPFVGVVTACLALAELARRIHGGIEIEVTDMSLRTPLHRVTVPSARAAETWSHGFTKVRSSNI